MRPSTREALEGYLGISPWLIGFLLFTLGPLVASFVLSFSDWQITVAPKWVGIDNYVRIFTKDPDFYQSLKVTFTYVALSLPVNLVAGLGLSLLLNHKAARHAWLSHALLSAGGAVRRLCGA